MEEKEKNAAEELFSMLPESAAKGLSSLFNEYICQESIESKIVKSADKLMPLIQNLCTNEHHSSYRKLNVEFREVLDYMNKYFSGGVLEEFYQNLLAKAHDNGVFSEPEAKA
ncbi:MAG: HD domain-containing protein [Proteobacteria bacterium]|nr:HD domain-containing protein [Pseudomonadota bacterium]